MHRNLRQRRRHTGQEIESEETPVPEGVLDVVAEDPQVEHVAGDVEQPAVHKHGREDRHDRMRELAEYRAGAGDPARYNSKLEDERLGRPRVAAHPDRGLVKEDENVQSDQAEGHERDAAVRDVVLERDHRWVVGWSTTTVGWVRYRSAARATSAAVTASIARA